MESNDKVFVIQQTVYKNEDKDIFEATTVTIPKYYLTLEDAIKGIYNLDDVIFEEESLYLYLGKYTNYKHNKIYNYDNGLIPTHVSGKGIYLNYDSGYYEVLILGKG